MKLKQLRLSSITKNLICNITTTQLLSAKISYYYCQVVNEIRIAVFNQIYFHLETRKL